MQKIILDTNVIVSALISSTIPSKILYDYVLTKKLLLCLSDEIYLEYTEVLNRDKFTKFFNFRSKAAVVLNKLSDISNFYFPDKKIDILNDKSDNKFLELALESSAEYLITGNTTDFQLNEFENTKILTPREYWEIIKL